MPLRDARRGTRATIAAGDRWHVRLRTLGARVGAFLGAQTVAGETAEREAERSSPVLERSFAEELATLVTVAEPPSAESPSAEPTVLGSTNRTSPGRAIPLTRMPLRHQSDTVTWPTSLGATEGLARSERHARLAQLFAASGPGIEDALVTAYREEDVEGRLLALRALASGGHAQARAALVDALRVGSDAERSFAIDALIAANERAEITPAFSDRLEAIAAQAALGYVGTRNRADYLTALEPFADRTRIDAILSLLAGIVE